MPNAVMISTYEQRKAAVLRAAKLMSSSRGSDGEREFQMLTEAIADFDIRQDALGVIEIPPAFKQFLSSGHQGRVSSSRR